MREELIAIAPDFKGALRDVYDMDLKNEDQYLDALDMLEERARAENIELTDENVLEYGRACRELHDKILWDAGTEYFVKELNRRYPDGCIVYKLSEGFDDLQLKELSEDAMESVSEGYIEICEDIYEFFAERQCLCTGQIGEDGEILTLFLEFYPEKDYCEPFVRLAAMLACYGGSIIMRCDDTKEIYMFGNYTEDGTGRKGMASVKPQVIDGFIKNNSEYLEGYKGAIYIPPYREKRPLQA